MPEVGPRIAVYGKSRALLFALGTLAALLAAASGLVLPRHHLEGDDPAFP